MANRLDTQDRRSIGAAEAWRSIAFSTLAPTTALLALVALAGGMGRCHPLAGWFGPAAMVGAFAYILGVALIAVRLQDDGIKSWHALAVTVALVPLALALVFFAGLLVAARACGFD